MRAKELLTERYRNALNQPKELLNERFFNAFSHRDKVKYSQEIWDMLQRSYKPIGGIHGNGFKDIEDMIKSNHMFKVGLQHGKPVMVTVYKNKDGGRKKVAMGTDGSARGKEIAINSLSSELNTGRAYGEFSGPVFGAAKKLYPPEILTSFLVPATEVSEMIGKEISIGAGPDMKTMGENDPYSQFYYQRDLGGEMHTKVAYGDPKTKARF